MPPTETETRPETQGLSPDDTRGEEELEDEDLDDSDEDDADDEEDDDEDSGATDDEDDATDGEDSDDDEDVDRDEAWREAERAAIREQVRAELIDESRKQEREQKTEAVKTAYPNALRDARAAAARFEWIDESGQRQTGIPKDVVDAILAPLDKHNLVSWQTNEELVHQSILDQLYSLVPSDQHEAFTAANNQKDLKEWVADTADRIALSSKTFKAIETVDDLLKHAGTKLKADLALRDKKSEEAGYKRGLKGPGGEPRLDGKPGATKTWNQLRKGYGEGTLSDAEEAEYHRQREAREKAS